METLKYMGNIWNFKDIMNFNQLNEIGELILKP